MSSRFFFFFWLFLKKNFLKDTCPFWGLWYPCFGFLVTSPLGLKARVVCLICVFFFAEANVMYIPQDAPLVLHMPTSWWPAAHKGGGLDSDSNGQSPRQKTNALPLSQRPGYMSSRSASVILTHWIPPSTYVTFNRFSKILNLNHYVRQAILVFRYNVRYMQY